MIAKRGLWLGLAGLSILLLWLGKTGSTVAMLAAAAASFVLAYRFYGGFLSRLLGLGSHDPTPAHTQADGIDYVAAPMPVVLGHHFASIAGAAPIIGPITAAQFGWLPVFLWIILGGIFLGAVHDLTAMAASLRHKGRSVGEIIEEYLGYLGKTFFLLFAWATLILVIAVFTILVAKTFTYTPAAGSASLLFLLLAVLFGFTLYRWKLNFAAASVAGCFLVFGALVVGLYLPLDMRQWSSVTALAARLGWTPVDVVTAIWTGLLMIYIFFASVTPVHILLQPRDYLNSFLLYGMLLLGLLGVLVMRPTIQIPAYTTLHVEGLGWIFPMLFVTVACGAISGFHSLVSSGTSAKQLDRERDALPVAYGGMLIECMLAILALITAIMLTQADYAKALKSIGPATLFSQSLGGLMNSFGLPREAAISFTALTVSAFALTSLDTATRLARFLLQELFLPPHATKDPPPQKASSSILTALARSLAENRYLSTTITVALGGALALSGQWQKLWPLFGAANQLLASLALLTITVWLAHQKINHLITLLPTVLMYAVTQSALISITLTNYAKKQWPMVIAAGLLILLSLFLAILFVMDRFAPTKLNPAPKNS